MESPYRKFFTGSEVQEEHLLDFTYDGINFQGRSTAARRAKIVEIRNLVSQVLNAGDAPPLAAALEALAGNLEEAVQYFQQCAQRIPEQAEFCQRNVEAYGRARAALDDMYGYFEGDTRGVVLTKGYSALESAVNEVDEMVEEEETQQAQRTA